MEAAWARGKKRGRGGTREDQECWGAAANGDVRAGRSGRRRKRGSTPGRTRGECSDQRTAVQSPEAEVRGCAEGAELRVEREEVKRSGGCGVRRTGLEEALAFSSG